MESALAWIGQPVELVASFFPHFKIVRTTHGMVKWVGGSRVVSLGPGWHWYWPCRTEVVEFPTARQSINLANQTITTTDDKTIMVGGMVVFEVHDIAALVAYTFDPDDAVKDIASAAVHDVCCTKTWEQLKAGQRDGSLDRELRAEMKKGLSKYGVTIIRTTLNELALCRVIKIVSGN